MSGCKFLKVGFDVHGKSDLARVHCVVVVDLDKVIQLVGHFSGGLPSNTNNNLDILHQAARAI